MIDGTSQVHGVLVVATRHQVYATATGADQMVILDENTGQRVGQARTGAYPDDLAFDPVHQTVWTTNESGGSETIIDPSSGRAVSSCRCWETPTLPERVSACRLTWQASYLRQSANCARK